MSYQALYRVWRPQNFEDVVGQEHITKTLQNALVQEKFSHAYLFSGPRGTGKTSAAKIVAKAINCERAPTSEPCNSCYACEGITKGSVSDVIEIDAASNNGVAEIRYIRDNVKLTPGEVRYKVYIIDEVHMLSEGAFNALLKTLEEPPKHVIFILATTEPHKIPLTIISRCQRFDFRRIPTQAMVERMVKITDSQGITIEENALYILAQAAEGGMRDALSLLDQAISFSDDTVTVSAALAITGAVSQVFLSKTSKALIDKDIVRTLEIVDELVRGGKEPIRFIEDLIFYFRDMLLFKTAPNLEKVFERAAVDEMFKELAENAAIPWIYEAIELLNQSQQEMKYTNHPKIFLEVALVKLCNQVNQTEEHRPNHEVEQLVNRIQRLEHELSQLKVSGVSSQEKVTVDQVKRPKKVNGKGFTVPTGKINNVLKSATKQDLRELKTNWPTIMEKLKKKKISAHATLIDSEPVAASHDTFILAFKYEIHCKMASENRGIIEEIIGDALGHPLTMVEVPDVEWQKLREAYIRNQRNDDNDEQTEAEEDPFIAEAKKLFGDDLIEIKE